MDIGIKPGNGLQSPHIALLEVEKGVNKAISKINNIRFLSIEEKFISADVYVLL
jgi:hypothetical protein